MTGETLSETQRRNVEAIRQLTDALGRSDRDEVRRLIAEHVHPDSEWMPLLVGVEGGPYRGPDGAAAWFDDLLDSFEVRLDDSDIRSLGERGVLLLATLHLRGRQSGVDVLQAVGIVYEFEDGQQRRGRVYPNHAEALSAAEALDA